MTDFHIEDHPVVFLKPRLSYPYAWVGHIPFAYLLVDLLRPRLLVELGTDSGNSYLAFCQAVVELGAETKCTAVDSWEGDPHARRYGEGVYESLKSYHDPRYAAFSCLHRSYFADAVATFADGSIDLLHIDGLHTYEAVSEDFHTWLPKLSDRAVVIFHDSQVRDRGFGVAQFLDELRDTYRIAEFEHSNGLGIALVGKHVPAAFMRFMDAFDKRPRSTRRFFAELGASLISTDPGSTGPRSEQIEPGITCRAYYRSSSEIFENARAGMAELSRPQGRHALEIDLPQGVRPDFVRLDPADHPGVFEIMGVSLTVGDDIVELTDLASRVRVVSGDLIASPPSRLRLVSFGDDPHVELSVNDIVHGFSAHGAVRIKLTIDYQVIVNVPALWPMAQAQEVALRQVKAHLESTVASQPAPAGAALSDIATVVGAMHVAGAVMVPGAGPTMYSRGLDDAYTSERRVGGHIIGLGESAEFRFHPQDAGSIRFARLDVPSTVGAFRMSGLIVNGDAVGDFTRRMIPVHGTTISHVEDGCAVISSPFSAPSVEIDLSDFDSVESLCIKVARDYRTPWQEASSNELDGRLAHIDSRVEASGLNVSARLDQLTSEVRALSESVRSSFITRLLRRLRR
ncbi:MAG: class I SAM-dependent methyltransferase [Luteibacter sp.]|uniref:class I SAM-dependent methyltransferase n=1 Tax=Luteibacter sp. TaxID=1886636 RepID=UPI002806A90F|nr:class I SAM-dependent methyltransferase [Luteibacter sp.]MDQ7996430.1 class I SAM-dependent methyltransferase [Luteibacter sp.]MDQ8047942.1 class I SAM-dependent methyltransferase [Luteibacter sp.]